jgi:hypothetical protein
LFEKENNLFSVVAGGRGGGMRRQKKGKKNTSRIFGYHMGNKEIHENCHYNPPPKKRPFGVPRH